MENERGFMREHSTARHRKHSYYGTGKRVANRLHTDRTYDTQYYDTGFTTDENKHTGYTFADVKRHYPPKHGTLSDSGDEPRTGINPNPIGSNPDKFRDRIAFLPAHPTQ